MEPLIGMGEMGRALDLMEKAHGRHSRYGRRALDRRPDRE
jgi:hypothetical protein